MSQQQYNALSKTRLIDLANVPAGLLIEYLAGKPSWYRDAIFKMLSHNAWA
ncbi:hypothetical protein [Photobacterium leiognathi]|uniref:hypothetical protein n=1 Tax=Photobacterium leiognathi TaxID=553611 RepID=UPI0015E7B315|nr:hypothetical protein [Photobacterium leiognathi]